MTTREIGNKGENAVCWYLRFRGYRILDRNYTIKGGEIDIVAYKRKVLHFVEVKTRKSDAFGTPMEAITRGKYNNIKTGVLSYIQENKIKNYQIDAIGITLQPTLKIQHLKNI